MSAPNRDDDAVAIDSAPLAIEFFVRKRMFSLYVSGREISLDQKEFAIFLNLVARRGGFVASEWLSDAVYGILHEDDATLRLTQDMARLRESLSAALGYDAIEEDRRGYALSDAVAFKVRAL